MFWSFYFLYMYKYIIINNYLSWKDWVPTSTWTKKIIELQYHFAWKPSLDVIWFNLLLKAESASKLGQVALSFIQVSFENLHNIYCIFQQTLSVFYHSHSENHFRIHRWIFSFCSLWSLLLVYWLWLYELWLSVIIMEVKTDTRFLPPFLPLG